ncbi:MAG TPA: DUF4232 domain-containing protein [Nocardioidaceae bacterium]|nr:DUF4232 domain-containing protein [Nocardioidaceae bacterium]
MTEPADRMDALLGEYADRWRDTQPDPPVVAPSSWNDSPHGPSRWWLVPAAAAAVAAVIVGVAVSGPGTPQATAPPAAHQSNASQTPVATGVVPWKPLPATHPDIPTHKVPPSPDPAVAAQAPPCKAGQLKVTREPGGAAAGTLYYSILLQLRSGAACRLEGRPDVRLLDHGRAAAIPLKYGGHWADGYRGPVLVGNGEAASIRLAWTEDWCAPPVTNDQIVVTLPSGRTVRVQGLGKSPICNDGNPTASNHKEPVWVYDYAPLHVQPGHRESAYKQVDAQISGMPRQVTVGKPLDFVVTLTARNHDVTLDPCPDFTVVEPTSRDTVVKHRFGLNCSGVRHRDASRRPLLPAGVPVRFAIQTSLHYLPPGGIKLSWVLDVPDIQSDTVVLFPAASRPTPSAAATCEPTKVSLVVAGRTLPEPLPTQPVKVKMHVGDVLEFDATGNCADQATIYPIGRLKAAGIELIAPAGKPLDGEPGTRLKAVSPGSMEFDITQPTCARPAGPRPDCHGGFVVLRRVKLRVLP